MPTNKQKVYEKLRFQIIRNQLRAGEILNEKKLMAQFKIGRTPLREIFLQLQRDKLIQIIPRMGTLVAPLDFINFREIVEIRRALEALAGQLAVKRITDEQIARLKEILKKAATARKLAPEDTMRDISQYDMEFHDCLYEATQNTRLKEMLHEQQNATARYWFQLGLKLEDLFFQMEQLEIAVKGLEERNVEKVQIALQKHIELFVDRVKSDIL